MKHIPLSVPNISKSALNYVSEAVETAWVSTGGPFINQFEAVFSDYVGAPCAAMQSGTASIHIGLILCGVKPGDLVLVPTLTFIAAVNPVSYLHAKPVFMDCDDSLTIDPKKVKKFLETECVKRDDGTFHQSGKKISALICVHVFGNLSDMDALLELSKEYKIPIVEDATESLGTFDSKGKFAGTFGDFGAFSFNGNKIITTGGGGMICAQDISKAKYLSTQAKDDPLYYQHDSVGYNYRMTNVQAAIGLSQMEDLESFIEAKNRNYFLYEQGISGIVGLRLLPFREDIRSNRWFYSLFVEDSFPFTRDELLIALKERGIDTRPIWGLIHEQKPYQDCMSYEIEKAYEYYNHVLNIPCSTSLMPEEVDYVIEQLKELSHVRSHHNIAR